MTCHETIRVLHMEDDAGLGRLFQRRLHRAGYLVDIATDGDEGLVMYAAGQYDVLAIDHMMPGLTGIEVIRRLAARGPLPPTVMITGAGNEAVAVEAMKLGASDYIIKDADGRYLELLPSVIERALKERRLLEEKQRAEEALRSTKESLEALLNATRDLAFLLDVSGAFLALNEATCEVLGEPCGALCGKSPFDLFDPELAESRRARFLDVIRDGVAARFVDEASGRHFENTFYPITDEHGRTHGVAVYVRDVTEQKKTQDFLLQTERLKAVGELASGVAHNFNNLLQIVIGGVQMALMELESGELAEIKPLLEQVVQSSHSGAETVKRLQSFAGLRADLDTAQGKICSLSEVVAQAVEMTKIWWKSIPEKSGIRIDMLPALAPVCDIFGRQADMFEVAINLIKNAVEALPDGGSITVETFVRADRGILRVTDTGTGIPPENLRRVFEPFFTTKGFQRAGMGLASSYGIISRLGGTLSVESEPGQGTTVLVEVPVAEVTAAALDSTEGRLLRLDVRVLVVDDMEPVVTTLDKGLTRYGATVLTALTGPQGVQLFRVNPVDVVICDLGMPGMNGWEVGRCVRAICEETGRTKPPFVLLTGWGGQLEEKEKIVEAGVDGIIEKPVDMQELVHLLRTLAPRGA